MRDGSFQLFPDTAEQARARSGPHGLEGFEYYISGPTAHPRSAKFLTWSSIDHMAFFDAFRFVSLIGQRPLLMIVGCEAVTSWISIQALQKATGPRELHWIDGASHNNLYYKEQYVGRPSPSSQTSYEQPCRCRHHARPGCARLRRPDRMHQTHNGPCSSRAAAFDGHTPRSAGRTRNIKAGRLSRVFACNAWLAQKIDDLRAEIHRADAVLSRPRVGDRRQ